ncbi:MAG: hypothetical protein SVG88_00295 [Halobacteriales archaeon]|nr:hypothetical protein [Halobacteriales archaeon]
MTAENATVYRLHSTLEVPLEDLHDFFDDAEYPEGIEDVEITRRNNTLTISAVAADDTMSKYTPTAQLKATVIEKRIPEEPPEPGAGSLQWRGPMADDEEEEEIPTKLVEYAGFKGDRETVLQNTELQYRMFQVLCDLAQLAEGGTLTAISSVDDTLEATLIVEGEERPATIEVVEERQDDDSDSVNWRDNEFISG